VKLSSPRLWISLASLAAVLLAAVIDTGRASPGPLSTVHALVKGLDGGSSCSKCHGGLFSNMTASCSKCHAPIAQQIHDGKGLHGVLEKSLATNCASCHGEHHGESFAVVNAKSFSFAGVPDVKTFDHLRIGFEMNGRHLEIGCADCHENADKVVLAEGQTRYLGLAQDCASCHEDVHKGKMRVNCNTCHGQTSWTDLHSFGHERRLPLVGGHADVACRTCHANGDAHALETLGESTKPIPTRECADCHVSPHAPAFARGVAELAGKTSGAGCVTCHLAEHTDFGEASTALTSQQHAVSGFVLDVPHDQVECKACHAPNLDGFRARYPGRTNEACSVCHDDPHGGQFAKGPFARQECTACHDKERFEPHAFTVEKHALASLCELCHKDAHRDFFDETAIELRTDRRGTCAVCHLTTTFADLPPQGFDHEHWTGFAVVGAHAESECSICHRSSPSPDDTGRRFGRVEQRFAKYEGCNTCHADVHKGIFDRNGLPAEISGKTDCARCHEETSFRSFPRGFDHGLWTGFALVGEHEKAACSACHEPARAADNGGRTWAAAAGAACADCHIDPHAGQFAVQGSTDCAHCHAAGRKQFLAFNHDRDSKFKLGEQHRALACEACHKPYATAEGLDIVRFRPLGTQCVDCHGMNEEVLTRRKRRGG
jgi:hypothetical protein